MAYIEKQAVRRGRNGDRNCYHQAQKWMVPLPCGRGRIHTDNAKPDSQGLTNPQFSAFQLQHPVYRPLRSVKAQPKYERPHRPLAQGTSHERLSAAPHRCPEVVDEYKAMDRYEYDVSKRYMINNRRTGYRHAHLVEQRYPFLSEPCSPSATGFDRRVSPTGREERSR